MWSFCFFSDEYEDACIAYIFIRSEWKSPDIAEPDNDDDDVDNNDGHHNEDDDDDDDHEHLHFRTQ